MKSRFIIKVRATLFGILAVGGCVGGAQAADGTWTALTGGDASGTWQTPGNWSGGTEASGSGFTANFSTLNITVDSTVTLSGPVVIGNLTFGDTNTGSAASWAVSNGGVGANTLTLAGTTPTITVSTLGTGRSVTLNTEVAGTDGLVKTGTGRLVLSNANSYTGALTDVNFGAREFGTIVNRGRLVLGNATAAGADDILVIQGAGTGILDLNGQTVANDIALRQDTYLQNTNTGVTAVVNGDVTISNYGRIGSVAGDGTGTVQIDGTMGFAATSHNVYFNLNGGTSILNGTNGVGIYHIQGGVLRANDGTGINSSAQLRIAGGVWESGVNVVRALGTAAGQVTVGGASTGTGNGFSAFGAPVTVALGGLATPTALVWGSTNFLPSTSTLVLNAATANNTLTLANALDLNGTNRTITVAASTAVVAGDVTNSTGTAGLTKDGAGILELTGANTYNGQTVVSAGTLVAGVANIPGAVTTNAAFVLNQATDASFNATIDGTGTFEKRGAGVLTLGGTNSYAGTTAVTAGTLRLGSASALGTGSAGVTVASGAVLDLNGNAIASTLKPITISGNGLGSGALVNGSVTSSTIRRLDLAADATIGGTGRIDVGFGPTAISGGTNTLTKTGAGTLVINTGATTIGNVVISAGTVSVVNTATGLGDATFGTSVASGASLQFFNNTGGVITNSEPLSLAGGAELASTTTVFAVALNGPITLGTGTTTVRVEASGMNANTLSLGGGLTGDGGLSKTSAGTLVLTGASDYTGGTTVVGGRLLVNNVSGSATGSNTVTVNAAATLAGAGFLDGPVSLSGILAPGNSIGTLTVDDDVTWNGSLANGWQFELGAGNTADLLALSGSFVRGTGSTFLFDFQGSTELGTYSLVNWGSSADLGGGALGTNFAIGDFSYTNLGAGLSGSFAFNGSSLEFTAVPEPGALALLIVGGVALAAVRRRRMR